MEISFDDVHVGRGGTFLVLSCCPLACKNSTHWKIPAQGPNNGERNRVPPPSNTERYGV